MRAFYCRRQLLANAAIAASAIRSPAGRSALARLLAQFSETLADSAECARLRSSPDCQAEDALFAARSLQAQHLVLGAPLFAVAATT